MADSRAIDSPFILGMRNLHLYSRLDSPAALADWIEQRVADGLHWFDHADIYGDGSRMGDAEARFGEALAQRPALKKRVGIIAKTAIVPATLDSSPFQVKHYNSSADYLTQSIDASLTRLGVERLDHLLLHRPDPLLDPEITARALEEAVSAGKVGAIGVSNHLPTQWRRLQAVLSLPLILNQFELSIARSTALFDGRWDASCHDRLQTVAYSPLFGGRLFEGALVKELLCQLAEQHGLSPAGIALAWLDRIPNRPTAIIGSLRPERINALLDDAAKSFTLERTAWFALLESARAYRVL